MSGSLKLQQLNLRLNTLDARVSSANIFVTRARDHFVEFRGSLCPSGDSLKPFGFKVLSVELGKGRKLADIIGPMRTVAEGVKTTRATVALAARRGVEMPITGVPLSDGEWDTTWLGDSAGWLEGSAWM